MSASNRGGGMNHALRRRFIQNTCLLRENRQRGRCHGRRAAWDMCLRGAHRRMRRGGHARVGHRFDDDQHRAPCLGLDRGMERPSDYSVMFAYKGDGARHSPEYLPPMECNRKVRHDFISDYGITTEEALASFTQMYGDQRFHLDEKTAAPLRDAEIADGIARQALRSGVLDADA